MIVPVFTPPQRIDASNVAAFVKAVREHVERYGCMVIDCTDVEWIIGVGMHALQNASSDASIALVNPNPAVHLMAVTFGGNVQCRFDPVASTSSGGVPRARLTAVHLDGKVAS
jgi:anti-anti-sigma regulatory factor